MVFIVLVIIVPRELKALGSQAGGWAVGGGGGRGGGAKEAGEIQLRGKKER